MPQFFKLAIDIFACDLIKIESLSVPMTTLEHLGLQLHPVSGEKFTEIGIIRRQNPGLSIVDISSVLLARDTNSCLLSGDKALVTYAKRFSIPVHGVIWILDELLVKGIIISSEACNALKAILANGARLPQGIVNQKLKSWC
jgi:predicted nucleic acid-binding protein